MGFQVPCVPERSPRYREPATASEGKVSAYPRSTCSQQHVPASMGEMGATMPRLRDNRRVNVGLPSSRLGQQVLISLP